MVDVALLATAKTFWQPQSVHNVKTENLLLWSRLRFWLLLILLALALLRLFRLNWFPGVFSKCVDKVKVASELLDFLDWVS